MLDIVSSLSLIFSSRESRRAAARIVDWLGGLPYEVAYGPEIRQLYGTSCRPRSGLRGAGRERKPIDDNESDATRKCDTASANAKAETERPSFANANS